MRPASAHLKSLRSAKAIAISEHDDAVVGKPGTPTTGSSSSPINRSASAGDHHQHSQTNSHYTRPKSAQPQGQTLRPFSNESNGSTGNNNHHNDHNNNHQHHSNNDSRQSKSLSNTFSNVVPNHLLRDEFRRPASAVAGGGTLTAYGARHSYDRMLRKASLREAPPTRYQEDIVQQIMNTRKVIGGKKKAPKSMDSSDVQLSMAERHHHIQEHLLAATQSLAEPSSSTSSSYPLTSSSIPLSNNKGSRRSDVHASGKTGILGREQPGTLLAGMQTSTGIVSGRATAYTSAKAENPYTDILGSTQMIRKCQGDFCDVNLQALESRDMADRSSDKLVANKNISAFRLRLMLEEQPSRLFFSSGVPSASSVDDTAAAGGGGIGVGIGVGMGLDSFDWGDENDDNEGGGGKNNPPNLCRQNTGISQVSNKKAAWKKNRVNSNSFNTSLTKDAYGKDKFTVGVRPLSATVDNSATTENQAPVTPKNARVRASTTMPGAHQGLNMGGPGALERTDDRAGSVGKFFNLAHRSIIQARQEMPLVKAQLRRAMFGNRETPYVTLEHYNDMVIANKFPGHYYRDVQVCACCFKVYTFIDQVRAQAVRSITRVKGRDSGAAVLSAGVSAGSERYGSSSADGTPISGKIRHKGNRGVSRAHSSDACDPNYKTSSAHPESHYLPIPHATSSDAAMLGVRTAMSMLPAGNNDINNNNYNYNNNDGTVGGEGGSSSVAQNRFSSFLRPAPLDLKFNFGGSTTIPSDLYEEVGSGTPTARVTQAWKDLASSSHPSFIPSAAGTADNTNNTTTTNNNNQYVADGERDSGDLSENGFIPQSFAIPPPSGQQTNSGGNGVNWAGVDPENHAFAKKLATSEFLPLLSPRGVLPSPHSTKGEGMGSGYTGYAQKKVFSTSSPSSPSPQQRQQQQQQQLQEQQQQEEREWEKIQRARSVESFRQEGEAVLRPALAAIAGLTRDDILEIRLVKHPSTALEVVVEALMLTLTGKLLPFAESIRLLNSTDKILDMMRNFDIRTLTLAQLERVEAYTSHPLFRPEHVRKASACAAKFCAWVCGIVRAAMWAKSMDASLDEQCKDGNAHTQQQQQQGQDIGENGENGVLLSGDVTPISSARGNFGGEQRRMSGSSPYFGSSSHSISGRAGGGGGGGVGKDRGRDFSKRPEYASEFVNEMLLLSRSGSSSAINTPKASVSTRLEKHPNRSWVGDALPAAAGTATATAVVGTGKLRGYMRPIGGGAVSSAPIPAPTPATVSVSVTPSPSPFA